MESGTGRSSRFVMNSDWKLVLLPEEYAICRLPAGSAVPPQVWGSPLASVTRSAGETSIVCEAGIAVPEARCEKAWRALRVAGTLDFALVGVLARLTRFLADAGVSVFALSTYDTDYLLIPEASLRRARSALRKAGYVFEGDAPRPEASSAQGLRTRIRRKELAVYDEEWITAFLRRSEYGTLALCDAGEPFAVTRNFVYDAERHAVYLHGARQGRTFSLVRGGAAATFNVSRAGRLLPAQAASKVDSEYAGVVLFGKISLVKDTQEAERALRLLLGKYFPHLRYGEDYTGITPYDLKITAVLRLDIEAWSGKEKRGAEEHPGAFSFGERV